MAAKRSIHTTLGLLLVLFSLFIAPFAVAADTAFVVAEEGAMQEEPPHGTPTSHLNKRMYMYGIQDGAQQYSNWETWTHAGTDGTSDDSFSENNVPGQANSGGGTRAFTFMGSAPNPEVIRLDPNTPFLGSFSLTFFCDLNCESTSEQVRIELLYQQNSIGGVILDGPVEEGGNLYQFNISHDLSEIEENVSLGLRIEFTKPHDVVNGGYTLYLQNDFYLDVPALAPEEFVVEVEEGGAYESPFAASGSGYSEIDVDQFSSLNTIIWGLAVIVCGILLIMFTPYLNLKVPATIIAMLGLIFSMTVMPFIVMTVPYDESELGSKVLTIDQIVSQGDETGQFLSGFPEGTEFQLWMSLDSVYENNVDTFGVKGIEKIDVYGLGFDHYAETLADPSSTSKHGLSKVQQYFSLLEVDPTGGHGILIDVTMVKRCPNCVEVVPQWGLATETGDGGLGYPVEETRLVPINNGQAVLFVVPKSAITVTNTDPSWIDTPMYVSIGGCVLMLGVGALLQHRSTKAYEMWMLEQEMDEESEDV